MPARRSIEFGDSITGMLIDGIEGTPYVAATLNLNESGGVQVEVPYIDLPSDPQFKDIAPWFNSGNSPKNLLLTSLDGEFSLYDCHYSGHSVDLSRGIGIGKVTPSNLVLHARDGEFTDRLEVQEVRSHIDGIIDWTQYGAIKQSADKDDQNRVKKVTIEVASLDEMSWKQGDATMRLSGNWSIDPARNALTVRESASLTSSFECPKPVEAHLEEHRKVAALLSFVFGCAIYFRRHEIRDSRFNGKTLSGKVVETPFYQVVNRNTVKEHSKPAPSRKNLLHPIADFKALGQDGLAIWAREYDDWGRFIHPALSALNRPGAILENLVVNAAMSLEAAGNLIGRVDGESVTCRPNGSPTTATYMYRCLVKTGWDWSKICASLVGLAKAIANNYNTIKHFDRGQFPDPVETHMVSSVTALTSRMLAIRVARPDKEPSDLFGARVYDVDRIEDEFDMNGIFVDNAGQFITR